MLPGEIPTQMKKWAASPIQTPPFISCNLYMTRDTNLPVIVTTESKIVLDAHLPHIKNLMAGTTLKVSTEHNSLFFNGKSFQLGFFRDAQNLKINPFSTYLGSFRRREADSFRQDAPQKAATF